MPQLREEKGSDGRTKSQLNEGGQEEAAAAATGDPSTITSPRAASSSLAPTIQKQRSIPDTQGDGREDDDVPLAPLMMQKEEKKDRPFYLRMPPPPLDLSDSEEEQGPARKFPDIDLTSSENEAEAEAEQKAKSATADNDDAEEEEDEKLPGRASKYRGKHTHNGMGKGGVELQ